jgi:hypothetical protein
MKEYTVQTDQRALQSLLSSREHNSNQVGDALTAVLHELTGMATKIKMQIGGLDN